MIRVTIRRIGRPEFSFPAPTMKAGLRWAEKWAARGGLRSVQSCLVDLWRGGRHLLAITVKIA